MDLEISLSLNLLRIVSFLCSLTLEKMVANRVISHQLHTISRPLATAADHCFFQLSAIELFQG